MQRDSARRRGRVPASGPTSSTSAPSARRPRTSSRYLRKGSRVAVDGRLEWREWETAEQQRRQAVSIVAESVQFLDAPDGARREDEQDGDPDEAPEGELVGVGAEEVDLVF